MTQKEFIETNWHRGNVAMLENGKEYLVKGTKGHGKYLLLYSYEYDKCFVADYRIVECRTSDYEEPEEIYLEKKRKHQEEAEARREAERQAYLQAKAERKQRNLLEQERIHQEALARKAAKAANQQAAAKPKAEAKPVAKPEPKVVVKPEQQPSRAKISEPSSETNALHANSETKSDEAPKRKRQRIRITRAEKVKF